MRTAQRILKNTVVLGIGKGLGDLASFLFLMLFGREFGAEFLGKYSFAMSLGGMVIMFSSLGFNTLIVKEVSRHPEEGGKYVGNLLLVRLMLSLFLWFLLAVVVALSTASRDTKIILILISGYHVFYRLTSLVSSGFSAREEMECPAFLEFFHRAVILSLGGAALFLSLNPFVVLTAYPLSAFLMLLLACLLFVRYYGPLNLRPDFAFIATATRISMPFFLLLLLGQFNERIGVILLTWLRGEAETGVFSASDRIMATMTVGIAFFGMALFPAMSRFGRESREKMLKLCRTSVRLLAVGLLPLALLLTVIADQVILLTFGKAFTDSIPILKILVWNIFFVGLNSVVIMALIVDDQQKKLVYSRVLYSVVFVAMGILFIHKGGGLGLAWANVVAHALYFPVCLTMAFKWQEARQFLLVLLVPLVSLGAGIAVFLFCAGLEPIITALLTTAAFFVAMILLRGISLNDIRYLNDIIFYKSDKAKFEDI